MASDGVKSVRIHREVVKRRYCHGKRVYKYSQLELTIPAKFEDIVEPFLYTDLKVEARRESNSLIIEAKPFSWVHDKT